MAMASRKLSSVQHSLLQRMAAGEVITRRDSALVVTVYALRNRGLVTLTPKRGQWTAELTDDGRTAASTGWVPPRLPVPRGRASQTPPATSAAGRTGKPKPEKKPDVAKQVVTVTRESIQGRADDKGMLHSTGDGVVPVTVSRARITRAMRVLASIFTAAERARLVVQVDWSRDRYGNRDGKQVYLVWEEFRIGLSIVEETDKKPHEPSKTELAHKARNPYARIPDWDHFPSGRLVVNLGETDKKSARTPRSRFADGSTAVVEDKVTDLVTEIVERGTAHMTWRHEQHRLDALYWKEREVAVEAARQRHLDDLRGIHATEQATRWREAQALRDFATAMLPRAQTDTENAWLNWISHRADAIDPPEHCPGPPVLPDDAPEYKFGDYLRRWPFERPHGWHPATPEGAT